MIRGTIPPLMSSTTQSSYIIANHFHMSILIILIINLCPPPSSSSSSSSSLFPLSGPLHATGYKSDLRNRRPQSEKSRWTRKLSPLDFIWTITFLGKYIVLCVQMQVCGYFIYHILQLSKKGQLRFEFRDNCQSFFAVKTLSICINKYVFDLLYKILSVKKRHYWKQIRTMKTYLLLSPSQIC